jgi:hypothetical protein
VGTSFSFELWLSFLATLLPSWAAVNPKHSKEQVSHEFQLNVVEAVPPAHKHLSCWRISKAPQIACCVLKDPKWAPIFPLPFQQPHVQQMIIENS